MEVLPKKLLMLHVKHNVMLLNLPIFLAKMTLMMAMGGALNTTSADWMILHLQVNRVLNTFGMHLVYNVNLYVVDAW